ncbi:hypothetical protein [Mycobacterium sp. Lab-001]|uniref:hypothetical protein n=1 Tax=Mycobacterium sp. Lab-001 TaxID=3410136 RepID=UPI003D174C0A
MSGEKQRPARYRLTFALDVPADLVAVQQADPAALDAAQAIFDDLAHGRVQGKLLGERRVSGDLTGLARVKFDIPSQRPRRFRLIYRQVDDDTRHVIAIGVRDEHAIYRTAVHRVAKA